jgi:hypothetical protein
VSATRGLAALAAIAAAFLAGCGPAEQARASAALVTTASDGFTIDMPACAGGSVGLFEVFASNGRAYSMRSAAQIDSDRDRIVQLEISTDTLRSKQFGAEVRVTGSDGAPMSSPAEIHDVYLNTDVGYVEFDPTRLPSAVGTRTVVTGKSMRPATASDQGEALLAHACG